jgi:L-asparagine transporter-like permease
MSPLIESLLGTYVLICGMLLWVSIFSGYLFEEKLYKTILLILGFPVIVMYVLICTVIYDYRHQKLSRRK